MMQTPDTVSFSLIKDTTPPASLWSLFALVPKPENKFELTAQIHSNGEKIHIEVQVIKQAITCKNEAEKAYQDQIEKAYLAYMNVSNQVKLDDFKYPEPLEHQSDTNSEIKDLNTGESEGQVNSVDSVQIDESKEQVNSVDFVQIDVSKNRINFDHMVFEKILNRIKSADKFDLIMALGSAGIIVGVWLLAAMSNQIPAGIFLLVVGAIFLVFGCIGRHRKEEVNAPTSTLTM